MMVKRNSEERRKYIRAKRILSIRHRLSQRAGKMGEDDLWHMSLTEDMSAGGILFTTNILYEMGDILEIQIVMSGVLDIFRGYGRVIRVEKKPRGAFYHIGVEYTDLKPRRRKAKSFLLKKRMRMSETKIA